MEHLLAFLPHLSLWNFSGTTFSSAVPQTHFVPSAQILNPCPSVFQDILSALNVLIYFYTSFSEVKLSSWLLINVSYIKI